MGNRSVGTDERGRGAAILAIFLCYSLAAATGTACAVAWADDLRTPQLTAPLSANDSSAVGKRFEESNGGIHWLESPFPKDGPVVPSGEFLLESDQLTAEAARADQRVPHTIRLPKTGEGLQLLPPGLLYGSYLAGEKESRFQSVSFHDLKRNRRVWESSLGGRAGILRVGTYGVLDPQGFQVDLEGAAMARVLPDEPSHMLEAVDFRFGVLGTWRRDQSAIKFGYYHISSHLGDELLKASPDIRRHNYVRDAAIVGMMRDLSEDWQVYGEIGYAAGAQGGAEPLEFQVGTQYASAARWSLRGAPFFAINRYIRQDFGFRRSINVLAGWQWSGPASRHRFRAGMQYFRGPSMQFSFPNREDELIGGGIWLDF